MGNGSLNTTIPLNPYNMVNGIKKFSKGSVLNTILLTTTAQSLLSTPISGSISFAANEIQTGDYMSFYLTGYYSVITVNVPPILNFTLWGRNFDPAVTVFPCNAVAQYNFTYKIDVCFAGSPATSATYIIDFNTYGGGNGSTTKMIATGNATGLTTSAASTLAFTGQTGSGTCNFTILNMVLTKF
jgi:hypothetical protein